MGVSSIWILSFLPHAQKFLCSSIISVWSYPVHILVMQVLTGFIVEGVVVRLVTSGSVCCA